MKLTTFLIIGLSFHFLFAFSQTDKEIKDIINLKKQNLKYQKRIEIETSKSYDFYNLAVVNTQSAKLILNKIVEGNTTEESDKEIASLLFHKANLYTNRSDSVANIIAKLQDSIKNNTEQIYSIAKNFKTIKASDTSVTAAAKAKELKTEVPEAVVTKAEAVKEESIKVETAKTETVKPEIKKEEAAVQPKNTEKIYTVQIKADKQSGDLVKGVENLKVIKCKDGYYRYFAGKYHSISEAAKAQKKLSGEGFSDCFVKAMPEE